MIGEKRNFSFIPPIVKLIICRIHDQYVEKKIVWFQKFSMPPPLPQKGFLLRPPPPPPLWKFWSSFIHLLKFLGLWEPPTPPPPTQEFPIPSVEGVWIFSGATPWITISMTKGIVESKDSHSSFPSLHSSNKNWCKRHCRLYVCEGVQSYLFE